MTLEKAVQDNLKRRAKEQEVSVEQIIIWDQEEKARAQERELELKRQARKQYEQKLDEVISNPHETIKRTKKDLHLVIKWPSSRGDPTKKSEIVELILEAIDYTAEGGIESTHSYNNRNDGLAHPNVYDYVIVTKKSGNYLVVNLDYHDQYVYEISGPTYQKTLEKIEEEKRWEQEKKINRRKRATALQCNNCSRRNALLKSGVCRYCNTAQSKV